METLRKLANRLVNNHILLQRMTYLADRWQDESKYEDFNDYAKMMHKYVCESSGYELEFVKATEIPFGIMFKYNNELVHLYVKSDSRYQWLAINKMSMEIIN